ncbi:UNVERIFIED_CONTAM: hypothetical protein PYX00_011774 [Menopon gallinae]|uniref:Signal recognition particle subunit SRP54 n=1 Tax=Menopon gallinae TaxID=328185 RepID=A0AAW2H8F7_9NEOP
MISDLGKSINKTLKSLFASRITDSKIELAIKDVCTHLLASNVSTQLVMRLRSQLRERVSAEKMAPGIDKSKVINQAVFDVLVDLLDPKAKQFVMDKGTQNVVVFVGLQGCGKTTSVCKFANFYKKKGFKVGIVCADTFRAGAFDQIKQNALKIKVPYFGSGSSDPVAVAREGVKRFKDDNFNLILVDTSGRHTQERDLFHEMKEMVDAVSPSNIVFVMDAGIGQIAETQASGFKREVDFGSIILTKIDGTKKAGGAISSVAATQTPIDFVGTGEGMEDFESFDPQRFVSRMLGMGDLQGLAEKLQDLKIDEKELMRKMQRGSFSLRDFYDQFQQLMGLGPLSKLMEMIPGLSNLPMPEDKDMKKMICIFDSMSSRELDSDGAIFEKENRRIIRVARGCGCSLEQVSSLLVQFRKISGIMKKVSSMPGMQNLLTGDPSKLTLTQKSQMMKQAKNTLPKELFDQMSLLLR